MASTIVGASGQDRSSSGHAGKGSISPLRQRMIRDMDLAGLSRKTQQTYIAAVTAIQKRYNIRPDKLSEKQVYDYTVWLLDEKGVAKGTFQTNYYGLKFFYCRFLGYDWNLFTKKKYVCPSKNVYLRRFRTKTVAA